MRVRAGTNDTSKLRNVLAPGLFFAAILGCMTLTGCFGPDRLKEWASPHVACSADAMDVDLIHGNRHTLKFDVACHTGEVYQCTRVAGSAVGTECEFIGAVEFADSDDEPSAQEPIRKLSPSNATWSRVHLDSCGASVLMPESPVARSITLHGVPGQSVTVETDGHEFAFFCFDFSNTAQKLPEARLAARMLDGMVESTGAEVIRVKPSAASLDFVLKVESGYHRGRVHVSHEWGYTTLIGPMQGLAAQDITRFVAGVEIGEPQQKQP